jgi:hypothetical protein
MFAMHTEIAIRFDYGSIIPWVTREGDHSLQPLPGLHGGAAL